ncbi:hypothetical protein Dimus_036052 [Dionaea muscipula]
MAARAVARTAGRSSPREVSSVAGGGRPRRLASRASWWPSGLLPALADRSLLRPPRAVAIAAGYMDAWRPQDARDFKVVTGKNSLPLERSLAAAERVACSWLIWPNPSSQDIHYLVISRRSKNLLASGYPPPQKSSALGYLPPRDIHRLRKSIARGYLVASGYPSPQISRRLGNPSPQDISSPQKSVAQDIHRLVWIAAWPRSSTCMVGHSAKEEGERMGEDGRLMAEEKDGRTSCSPPMGLHRSRVVFAGYGSPPAARSLSRGIRWSHAAGR